MNEDTYYTALGVTETATGEEIKRAYRFLLKKIHPDTVSTLSEETRRGADEATRELNQAYSVLSDPQQRAEYDYFLAQQRQAITANPGVTSAPPTATNSQNSAGIASGDAAISHERRRRRRRRHSHRRRRSSQHEPLTNLFHPASAADWLVLICYVGLAIAILAILVVLISSASNSGSEKNSAPSRTYESTTLNSRNGAGDRDRTGDIQLGKLAFYR